MFGYYGYGFNSGYFSSMIVLLPAFIFTLFVQAKMKSTYARYSNLENSKHITGVEAARILLEREGLSDTVPINIIRGDALTNYYDPRSNSLNLSEAVGSDYSIASMCIACHEVGHAIQHNKGYAPITIRNALVPLTNFTQGISWPLIMIGLVLTWQNPTSMAGNMLFNFGVICFLVVCLFHLVTLPVEFDASHRAIAKMQEYGIVDDRDLEGSKAVLRSAAMTYVAALATAVAALLRVLVMRGSRE